MSRNPIRGNMKRKWSLLTTGLETTTVLAFKEFGERSVPLLTRLVPTYRLHRPSGQAVVTLDGTVHYLGRLGSRESQAKYWRLIRAWYDKEIAAGRRKPPKGRLICDRILNYWRELLTKSRKKRRIEFGEFSKTRPPGAVGYHRRIKETLRALRTLHGLREVIDFDVKELEGVMKALLEWGYRKYDFNPGTIVYGPERLQIMRRVLGLVGDPHRECH